MQTSPKNYLSLFQGTLGTDPRPTRMAQFLSTQGHVTVCAEKIASHSPLQEVDFVPLCVRSRVSKVMRRVLLVSRQFEKDIWNNAVRTAHATLQKTHFDAIFCHDIHLLPLACALKDQARKQGKKTKIVVDLREYYPKQFENSRLWRIVFAPYFMYLCKKYLPSVDVACTVSPGLVRAYRENFDCRCDLIPSYPYYHAITPHSTNKASVCLIHHGSASPGRKHENMIAAVKLLPSNYTLDIMLMGRQGDPYISRLCDIAADCQRIRFVPPVSMPEIVPYIAQYDVGIYLLSPDSFNHVHALPNKLFEFIQARLAVAVSPCSDMRDFVLQNKIGVVADDFTPESFAAALLSLTPQRIDSYKQTSHVIAQDCSWEAHNLWIDNILRHS